MHSIYLTREERYKLHEGIPVVTTGVSIPVWFQRGSTSEPAEEIFCQYTITNKNGIHSVKPLKNQTGYKINLPQKPTSYVEETLSCDEFRQLTNNELNSWFTTHKTPKSSINLIDIKDGGAEYMSFKTVDRLSVNDETKVQAIHIVVLKRMEELEYTVTHSSESNQI